MTEDLFTHVAKERLKNRGPLADRLRPLLIDDVVGQKHLIGKDQPLRQLIETDKLSSLIPVSYTHLTLPTSDLV